MADHASGFTTLDEEVVIDRLPVRGRMPSWLEGTLVRNGPARFEVGEQQYRHWFDGLSMLRRFSFRNGEVSYANKFLESGEYRESMSKGRVARSTFATDPCRSIFQRVHALFVPEITDNANVNVAKIADRFIAMTETPLPIEFDPHTLETLGVFDYGQDGLDGTVTTAHPHFDFARGEAISYLTRFSRKSTYVVYRIREGSTEREPIVEMSVSKPAYMHSFGMSESFAILVEFPLVVSPIRMLVSGRPFIENYTWEPERGARFHVIGKEDGSVRTFGGEAFFAFHHVNAFERDGDVFVDIAAYPDSRIIDALYLDRLRGGDPVPQAELRRYRLAAGSDNASYEVLSNQPFELPRVNYERFGGREYRYAYGVSNRLDRPPEFPNQLAKVDVLDRSTHVWLEDGCYVGEPVFVAAPDATGEDEGVVLSVVFDAEAGHSFLLVLDAATFTEVARAEVPHHLPFGFHGQFFA